MRFEQSVVAVAILGGFVFRVPVVLPALTVILVTSVIAGPRLNLFVRIYDAVIALRMGTSEHFDDPDEARLSDLVGVGVLGLATVAIFVGLGGLAWILALVQAIASALRATAGIHVGATVHERLRRRG
ncbi:MAG: DUF4395 family protein [Acidimicrobiia bacterium]|nr:DUF4395 family protein [Acidimicrobiia bacterium]